MKTIVLLLAMWGPYVVAQDYSDYYQWINQAEEQFVEHGDTSCFPYYDRAFARYEPFLKDPYIAAQIALYLKDTTRFYTYLEVCFHHGMPLTAVDAAPIIRRAMQGELAQHIHDSFKMHFRSKQIDQELLQKICLQCYQSDSIKMTEGVNARFHLSENATRSFLLDSMLRQGKFPNERLLGITSDALWKDFYQLFQRPDIYTEATPFSSSATTYREEYELRLKCPYNIILHSNCFYTDHRDLFRTAMLNGYIHPKEIAILEETAILWNKDTGNPMETCSQLPYRICFNIFGYNPMKPASRQTFTNTTEGLKEVEANRKALFLQKYSVDLQKKELEKSTGIRFFFDFHDR